MFKKFCFALFFGLIFMVIGCGISGTVEDPILGPLDGVTVTLSGAKSDTYTTDADGKYVFESLLFGSYTVSADLSANGDCGIISKTVKLGATRQATTNFITDECLGACCLAINSCSPYITEDACDTAGGTFYGEGSDCILDAMPCSDDPIGACCETDDSCTSDVTEATCSGGGGTWTEDGTCGLDVVCGPPTGACCETDNSCSGDVTEAVCTGTGGIWHDGDMCGGPGGVVCDPTPTGACCNGDETCSPYITEATCDANGGTYQGDDTDCMDPGVYCDPTWACCLPGGSCDQTMTLAECTAASGTFHDGMPCGMVTCP